MIRAAFPAVMLLVVACSGGDGGGIIKQGQGSSAPWLELLAFTPDTPDIRKYIEMNDYAALRRLHGVEAPVTVADVADYRRKILVPPNGALPSHISGLGQQFDPEMWLGQLGFHPGQVDADLRAGSPPDNVEAVRGRFDARAIDAAIDKDTSAVRKLLTKTTHEGSTLYIWGEDNKLDFQSRSTLRPLGRGERLAVKGDTLLWAHSTAPVQAMLDAAAGKKPSLAAATEIKLLVNGLKKHDLYAVAITSETPTPDTMDVVGSNPSLVREARDASFREALKPYSWLAIGYGQDAQGPFSVALLLHVNEALAKENVAKLTAKIDTGRSAQSATAWKDLITAHEVVADGRVVVAKLRTTRRTLLTEVLQKRDSLLVHE
jgi:hypothetical protein